MNEEKKNEAVGLKKLNLIQRREFENTILKCLSGKGVFFEECSPISENLSKPDEWQFLLKKRQLNDEGLRLYEVCREKGWRCVVSGNGKTTQILISGNMSELLDYLSI